MSNVIKCTLFDGQPNCRATCNDFIDFGEIKLCYSKERCDYQHFVRLVAYRTKYGEEEDQAIEAILRKRKGETDPEKQLPTPTFEPSL